MSVVHVHFSYELVEGDAEEAKRRIADDVADSLARHLGRGSCGDLVTVVFHDMDPEYSVAEWFEDEIPVSAATSNPGGGTAKAAGRRLLRAADRPVRTVSAVGRAMSRETWTVAMASKARLRTVTGAAVSRMGRVGGEAYARIGEFSAALDEAVGEQLRKLDRDARELRRDPAAWCKATAASVGAAFLTVEQMVPSFGGLSPAVKAKFAMAGLRGAWRPVEFAQAFFEEGVPAAVRNLGEDAVLMFVEGKHASHIRAVFNTPERMAEHSNIVWEAAKDNLARGATDMSAMELAKANALNVLDATGIVMNQAVRTAAVAGCIGMALEGVVSIAENYIYVYQGEKDVAEAARDVAKEVLKKGGASAVGGVGWMVALSLGAGPAMSAAGPVIVTVGGVIYVVASYKRLREAWDTGEHPVSQKQLDPPPDPAGTA